MHSQTTMQIAHPHLPECTRKAPTITSPSLLSFVLSLIHSFPSVIHSFIHPFIQCTVDRIALSSQQCRKCNNTNVFYCFLFPSSSSSSLSSSMNSPFCNLSQTKAPAHSWWCNSCLSSSSSCCLLCIAFKRGSVCACARLSPDGRTIAWWIVNESARQLGWLRFALLEERMLSRLVFFLDEIIPNV